MPRRQYRSNFKWLDGHDAPPKRQCDHPGCTEAGEYRAPKSRQSNTQSADEYYWFCLDHVREYNKSWDYFEGMSAHDIDAHQRAAHTWERPTWRMGSKAGMEDKLREQVRGFAMDDETRASFERREREKQWRREHRAQNSQAARAEIDALAVLNLEPPVDFDAIKARYKQLVKEHHPDRHGGDAKAEERLKTINQAYSTLKTAFASIQAPADV
ncbi:MAG: J domain-containing protein [Alphaproteobacteria bacterium]|nr:J domain-containing protein [Alphaproteobacteria bacterium SS10]